VAFSALGARFHAHSQSGERSFTAEEPFRTHLTTSLGPDELLTEIEGPVPLPGTAYAFLEFARRAGGLAPRGAAALVGCGARGARRARSRRRVRARCDRATRRGADAAAPPGGGDMAGRPRA